MLSLYLLLVLMVVAIMLSSYFLGERSSGAAREAMYESGIAVTSDRPRTYFIHYFLLAVMFVIFDVESIFVYLWASSVSQLGAPALILMAFFMGLLMFSLIFVASVGAFDIPKRKFEDQA